MRLSYHSWYTPIHAEMCKYDWRLNNNFIILQEHTVQFLGHISDLLNGLVQYCKTGIIGQLWTIHNCEKNWKEPFGYSGAVFLWCMSMLLSWLLAVQILTSSIIWIFVMQSSHGAKISSWMRRWKTPPVIDLNDAVAEVNIFQSYYGGTCGPVTWKQH